MERDLSGEEVKNRRVTMETAGQHGWGEISFPACICSLMLHTPPQPEAQVHSRLSEGSSTPHPLVRGPRACLRPSIEDPWLLESPGGLGVAGPASPRTPDMGPEPGTICATQWKNGPPLPSRSRDLWPSTDMQHRLGGKGRRGLVSRGRGRDGQSAVSGYPLFPIPKPLAAAWARPFLPLKAS